MFGFGRKEPYILHVDDEPDPRFMVAELLTALGYRSREASSVAEGLELARKDPPVLILMDGQLPEVDGHAGCRMVRGDPILKAIPVIMLTGMNRLSEVEDAFSAGASDYIIKPVTPERLKPKLEKFLGPPK